ncbi:MAG: lamin tail domain-containing protein [Caldilineaceae bacterium]
MRHIPPFGALVFCIICLFGLMVQMASAQSPQPNVVISQIYGGGGNSGAAYTHDFIELFNRSSQTVTLTGWSVQYASAKGTNWQKTELTGTIQPQSFYLIQQAQGNRGTRALPRPDAIGAIPLSSSSGKVALLTTSELLPRGTRCPQGLGVVDLVGFGEADCFSEAAASGLDNKSASIRGEGGCTFTGSNSADFGVAPPQPRNSSSSPAVCAEETAITPAANPRYEPVFTKPLPGLAPRLGLTETEQFFTRSIPSLLSAFLLTPTATPSERVVSTQKGLVISQIYGGGGNAGAAYTHDFVELYNAGSVTATVDGWSVQYASSAGKTWLVTPLSGTVGPGGFLLIQQAQGTGGSLSLPLADIFGETAMSASSGKVALVRSAEPLAGICPGGEVIVDFVGYGRANCFEGTGPTATPSNTRAVVRARGGSLDTDDNQTDFLIAPPQP